MWKYGLYQPGPVLPCLVGLFPVRHILELSRADLYFGCKSNDQMQVDFPKLPVGRGGHCQEAAQDICLTWARGGRCEFTLLQQKCLWLILPPSLQALPPQILSAITITQNHKSCSHLLLLLTFLLFLPVAVCPLTQEKHQHVNEINEPVWPSPCTTTHLQQFSYAIPPNCCNYSHWKLQ